MIVNYHIVADSDYVRFCNSVNDSLRNGYQPLGGLTVSKNVNGQSHFYQAMGQTEPAAELEAYRKGYYNLDDAGVEL